MREQSIRLIAALARREIVRSFEIDRIDLFDRDEFPELDVVVRFGFDRLELASVKCTYSPLETS